MAGGSHPYTVEVDDKAHTIHMANPFNGRELNMNHGDVDAWAKALVEAVHEWNYSQEVASQIVEGAAIQLNGRGEQFREAATQAMAEIYV